MPAQAARHGARARATARYLPDVALPAALRSRRPTSTRRWRHARGGLLVIATPMAGLRGRLLRPGPTGSAALWLCKGFEAGSGALGHEIARELRPGLPCGVLSGPSFALEVARGQPTALVAASTDAALAASRGRGLPRRGAAHLHLRPTSVGVEVGGAVKNVLAIATGIVDGMAATAGA